MIRSEPDAPRFIYHSSAVTLGGVFTSPYEDALEAPTCALPASGGFASARVERFRYRDRVSCSLAYCEVRGRQEGKAFVSATKVVIRDLSVMDRLQADIVEARLVATHENGRSSIDPSGSRIVGLRLDGKAIDCEPRKDLTSLLHYEGIAERAQAEPKLWRRSREERALSGAGPEPMLSTPLFDTRAAKLHNGCSYIDVKDFGRIFLGEFLVSRHSRRLTMLRIELGCPVSGVLVLADESGNGHIYP